MSAATAGDADPGAAAPSGELVVRSTAAWDAKAGAAGASLPTVSPLVAAASAEAPPAKADGAASAAPLPAAAPPPPPPDWPWRRWIVLAISCIGVFLASVSTSALIIAFPKLIVELNTELATMMWVLLVVLLMIACVTPIAGKLGDVFGQATLYK